MDDQIKVIEGMAEKGTNRFTGVHDQRLVAAYLKSGQWNRATLFISKDATPPKVVALEEVLPYMQHKAGCYFEHFHAFPSPLAKCTCGMSEVLQRINERSK